MPLSGETMPANWFSGQAMEQGIFGQFASRLGYNETVSRFGLFDPMAVRSIAKVADSCKADKKALHVFFN
jgi:hypothetical protein